MWWSIYKVGLSLIASGRRVLSSFGPLVFSIVSRQFVAANWALVMLVKPFTNALLIEKVTAGHAGRLLCQILAADRAARKFLGVCICNFAVLISYGDLLEVLNGLLACWGCTSATSLQLRKPEDVLEDVIIAGK